MLWKGVGGGGGVWFGLVWLDMLLKCICNYLLSYLDGWLVD